MPRPTRPVGDVDLAEEAELRRLESGRPVPEEKEVDRLLLRKEAERREANRWEKEKQQSKIKGSRSEDCTINEMKKSGVVGKPLFSLMMQELDNSQLSIQTSA